MLQSALRYVLAGVGVFACVAAGSASQQSEGAGAVPAERATSLAGSWEFDENASKEDLRNWRRPVGSSRPISVEPGGVPRGGGNRGGGGMMGGGSGWGGGGFGGGGGYIPRPSSGFYEADLRRALRDLLEVAESFRIELGSDKVVITDDLERTLTFSTTGKKEKHRIGATNFTAKTVWEGGLLKQDIESVGDFHMSQVFFPGADGQTMFLSITVDRPEFKPPIKAITRTYRRVTQK